MKNGFTLYILSVFLWLFPLNFTSAEKGGKAAKAPAAAKSAAVTPKAAANSGFDVVILYSHQLELNDKLELILKKVADKYRERTGERVVPLTDLKAKFSNFGADFFVKCKGRVPCLLKNIRGKFPVSKALFIGAAGLGEVFLLEFYLLDLEQGKMIKYKKESFQGLAGIDQKLPGVLKELLPNYATLEIKTEPKNSTVVLEFSGKRRVVKPGRYRVPSQIAIEVKAFSKGFIPETQTVTLKTEELKFLSFKLKEKKVIVKKKAPTTKVVSSKKPFYQQWWFWAAVGGGVAVTTGVIIGIAASSGKDFISKDGNNIVVKLPTN